MKDTSTSQMIVFLHCLLFRVDSAVFRSRAISSGVCNFANNLDLNYSRETYARSDSK